MHSLLSTPDPTHAPMTSNLFRYSEGRYHFSAPGAPFTPHVHASPPSAHQGEIPRRAAITHLNLTDAPNPLSIEILLHPQHEGAKTKVVSISRHRRILIELSPVPISQFVISVDLNQLTLQLTRLSPESVCVGVVSLGQQTVSLLGPLHKGIADAVLQEQRDKNWHFIERAR